MSPGPAPRTRLRFYRDAFSTPLKLFLVVELLAGGWDTVTSHIKPLQDYSLPIIEAVSLQTWVMIVVVTLAIGISEYAYKSVVSADFRVSDAQKKAAGIVSDLVYAQNKMFIAGSFIFLRH